jgi:hypothetical protein
MRGTVISPPGEDVISELLNPPVREEADPQTRLTIHRTSEQDVQQRQVIFSLDGRRIAQLLYGQTFTCEIPPGAHQLRANNTLVWKTVKFLAPAGTHVHFTCINYAPPGMIYMLATFGVSPLFVALKPGLPQFVRL